MNIHFALLVVVMNDIFTLTNIADKVFPQASSSSDKDLFSDASLKKGFIEFNDLLTKANGSWLAIIRYVAGDMGDAENCTGFGHTPKQRLYWTITAYLGKFYYDFTSAKEDASGIVFSAGDLHMYHWDTNTENKLWLPVSENSFTLQKTAFNYVRKTQPMFFPEYLRFGAGMDLDYTRGTIPQIDRDNIPRVPLEKIPDWLCVVPQDNFSILSLFGGIPDVEPIVGQLVKSAKK